MVKHTEGITKYPIRKSFFTEGRDIKKYEIIIIVEDDTMRKTL